MLIPEKMPSPLVLESLSKAQFENELQALSKPFVVKGFAKDWDIVKASNKGTDVLNYLRQRSANEQVKMSLTRIPVSEQSRMFYDDKMEAMNFGVAELTLQSCLDRMQQTTEQGINHKEADYAAQCVAVSQYFPELTRGINNSLLSNDISPFIWFGNRVVVAPHFDESDNIAVVAAGRRRFTLFPPSQTQNLYIGPLDFTPAGQAISLVNIRQPDLNLHPRYKQAYKHGLSIELEAGDAVYIPTPWWHHVESLSDFNVLINYWWNQTSIGSAKPFAALLHAMQAFKALPTAQQEDFKALLDYYVFGDSELTTAHIPTHAHGWLGELDDKKRTELEHFIKAFSQ